MPATSRDQLLDVTGREFEKLERILDDLDEASALENGDDGTSIKDIVAHRDKWNELERYNADLRRTRASEPRPVGHEVRPCTAEGTRVVVIDVGSMR